MRDIKFRAWNKEEKRMIENASNLLLFQDWFCEASPEYLEARKVYELMQYTGLKDKNGKEVYEGDIVETNIQDGIYEVSYGEEIFDGAYRYTGIILKGCSEFCTGQKEFSEFVEVIGNIYENPELLEGGK